MDNILTVDYWLITLHSLHTFVCLYFLGSFILFAPIFEIKENRGHQSYYLRNRHTHSKTEYQIGAIGFVGCPIVIVLFDPIQPIRSHYSVNFSDYTIYSIFMSIPFHSWTSHCPEWTEHFAFSLSVSFFQANHI